MSFRCSASSREDHEPLIGTAPTDTRFLFVEHTGPWGRDAVQESRLPEHVRAHLAGASGVRVQLIRRHGGESGSGLRVVAAAADPTADDGGARVESAVLDGPESLLDLDLAGLATSGTLGLPAYDEELWLVCTNGRRDLCCADLGRTTTAALAVRWPEGTWETTHLGGHRFAATLLALPSLVTLGRLLPHEALDVCTDVAQGRMPLDHSRGRAGWPPVAQVADHHVRSNLGLEPVAAIRLVDVEGADVTLSVAGEDWRVTVTTVAGEPRRQSCADELRKPTAVHRVDSMVRRG
ncbi:MAG: sucrase ferredoxin [Nocardioides sp.]